MRKNDLVKPCSVNNVNMQNGITLIALVITIIVLLILAGITINLALDDNGIIKRSLDVSKKYGNVEKNELTELKNIENIIDNISKEKTINIPEGLSIGDKVSYTPPASTDTKNIYNWQVKYCSSGIESELPSEDKVLKNTDENYAITEWIVFDIDEKTGKVELISEKPTNGTVYLGGAQAYNNGVKLLNDACSNLYGNESEGIKARSMNVEDIENKIEDNVLKSAKENQKTVTGISYKTQPLEEYIAGYKYPVIYEKEKLSVINGKENENGLNISEQEEKLIERTEDGAENGFKKAQTSIKPYQTSWMLGGFNEYNVPITAPKSAFKSKGEISYYDIINISSDKTYWLASRCIVVFQDHCHFHMWSLFSGVIHSGVTCNLEDNSCHNSLSMRPILSLNSEIISGNDIEGWQIL